MTLHLGKAPATDDPRDLKLANYLDTTVLPKIPAQFGHERLHRHLEMLGNGPDSSVAPGFQGCGDCVWAGAANETMLWAREGGHDAPFTGRQCVQDYATVTGYRLGDDSTDQGTSVREAMKYRQKVGVVDANGKRHKIGAYLSIDPTRLDLILTAAYVFSAVGIGIRFPRSAMDQFNAGKPWDVVPGSPVEGGHYIPVVAKRSTPEVWTWARLQPMTEAFAREYIDEAWAVLSPEFLRGGKSPEGLNLSQLQSDLGAL